MCVTLKQKIGFLSYVYFFCVTTNFIQLLYIPSWICKFIDPRKNYCFRGSINLHIQEECTIIVLSQWKSYPAGTRCCHNIVSKYIPCWFQLTWLNLCWFNVECLLGMSDKMKKNTENNLMASTSNDDSNKGHIYANVKTTTHL